MATNIYLGNPPENIKKWIIDNYGPKEDNYDGPIRFTANKPNSSVGLLKYKDTSDPDADLDVYLQYSIDNMKTWYTWDGHIIYLDECEDKKMYVRADPAHPNSFMSNVGSESQNEPYFVHNRFKMEGSIRADGSIDYLLDSEGLINKKYGSQFCFSGLFRNCSALTHAPKISAKCPTHCYGTFNDMFYGCTSLIKAPVIVNDNNSVNDSMNYMNMFYGCTSLNYIEVEFTSWKDDLPIDYDMMPTINWLENVSEKGTFVCPNDLPEIYGRNYIPEGWTIVRK